MLSSITEAQLISKKNEWILIHGKVYDISKFKQEHPGISYLITGGEEILLEFQGKDAGRDYDDIMHSSDAAKTLARLYVGEFLENKSHL